MPGAPRLSAVTVDASDWRDVAQDVTTSGGRLLALWGTGDEFWDVDGTTGSLVRVTPLEHLEVSHAASEQTLRGYTPFVHEDDLAHFRATLQSLAKGEDESLDVVSREHRRNPSVLRHTASELRCARPDHLEPRASAHDRRGEIVQDTMCRQQGPSVRVLDRGSCAERVGARRIGERIGERSFHGR